MPRWSRIGGVGWLAAAMVVCAMAAGSPARAVNAARQGSAVVLSASGDPVAEIQVAADGTRITTRPDGELLTGDLRDGKKRVYRARGTPVAEVKFKLDDAAADGAGFKLRTPAGKLLWKVKIADAKIKISADEDGAHPWVISLKHGDKLEVIDGTGREVGVVRADATGAVRVADAAGKVRFTAKVGWPSALFGVLLIDGMPRQDAWILMAELLATGH